MATAVGPSGKQLAVDVQPEMIEILKQLAQKAKLSQIVPVLCSETDVNLQNSVDLAIMVEVYHELAYPFEMLASIIRALKPGVAWSLWNTAPKIHACPSKNCTR